MGFGQILSDWHFWALLLVYWFLMAAISNLPKPDGTEGHPKLYAWGFGTLQMFAANVKHVGDALQAQKAAADHEQANALRERLGLPKLDKEPEPPTLDPPAGK